jgi:hypothetical protein
MALLFAEPVSAVSKRASSYNRGCVEFDPGSNKLTNDGLATLNNMIRVFSGPALPVHIFINTPYVSRQIEPNNDEFRRGVSEWLDLAHARTKTVVDCIVASSGNVTDISVMQVERDACPDLELMVNLPGGLPDLRCDKTSCHPDK